MFKLIISLALSVAVLCGCSQKVNKPIEEASQNQQQTVEVPRDNSDPKPKYVPVKKADGTYVGPENNTYINEKAGYKIMFPEDFKGNYYAFEYEESDCNYVTIFFKGASKTCDNTKQENGLSVMELFSISNENDKTLSAETRDEIELIGTADGLKYYSHKPKNTMHHIAFNKKEEVTGDEYNLLSADEEKFTSLFARKNEIKSCFMETTCEYVINIVDKQADYYDSIGNGYKYSYWIPNINIDSDGAKSINNDINEKYYSVYEHANEVMNDNCSLDEYEIAYDCIINNDILSVIIWSNYAWEYTDYEAYNINIKTGERVENKDLARMYGYTDETFIKYLKETCGNYFVEKHKDREMVDYYQDIYELTISDEVCNLDIPMYIGNNGNLFIIAHIGSLAGAQSYETIIDTGLKIQ